MAVIEPIVLTLEPDSELAAVDTVPFDVELIRKCKVLTSITRAKYGKHNATRALFVSFQTEFQPYYDIRFKYVEIELRLVKPNPTSSFIAYSPKAWLGAKGVKNIQSVKHVGLNASSGGAMASGGGDAGIERTVEYAELKRAWLSSSLEQPCVHWRLCENDVTHEGVPQHFTGAVIISGIDDIALRVKYMVKLSKSTNPLSWTPGHARMTKPVVLDKATVGAGIGDVGNVENMESVDFRLEDFVSTGWDL